MKYMADGNRVYVHINHENSDTGNWHEIASFNHVKESGLNPSKQAQDYAQQLNNIPQGK